MRILLSLVAAPVLVACGGGSGGSGISSSKMLNQLTVEEARALCEELTFEREVTCDGETITIKSRSCVDVGTPPASCTATVGDARTCAEAQESAADADFCSGAAIGGTACAKLATCGMGGDGPPT